MPVSRTRLQIALAAVLGVAGALVPTLAMAEVHSAVLDTEAVTLSTGSTTAARVGGDASVDPFNLVAVSWKGSGQVGLDVRDRGGWQAVDATLDPTGPDPGSVEARAAANRRFSEATWVGSAEGYRVHATGSVSDVEVHLVRDEVSLRPVAATEKASAAPISSGPAIAPRSSWGAAPPTSSPTIATTLTFAVIHHTATSNNYTPDEVPAILRSIQAFHQQGRGWNDIAYNVLVDKFGRAWEGRGGGLTSPVVGAHAAGFNTGSVGVSLIGDLTTASPTDAMIDMASQVVGWKLAMHGIDPLGSMTITSNGGSKYRDGTVLQLPRVIGHRDVGSTDCPGSAYAQLPRIRSQAAAAYRPEVAGSFDGISTGLSRIRVTGWTLAPGRADQLQLRVVVDGSQRAQITASSPRPDVGAVFPAEGANHGFDTTIALEDGPATVCIYALHPDVGATNSLGCRSVNVRGAPIGSYEALGVVGGVATVAGWAARPSVTDTVSVRVVVNGSVAVASTPAVLNRPDVAAVYPASGSAHGFSFTFSLARGTSRVCVEALHPDLGTYIGLGCRTVTSSGSDPVGSLEAVRRRPGGVAVAGWTLDPDVTAPIGVHVYVNGAYAGQGTAGLARPDVGAVYPGLGDGHGYSFTVPASGSGPSSVCVFAINVGPGSSNPLLGCATVDLSGDPAGSLEAVTRTGSGLTAAGWALDPDVAAPIPVHFYVDGVYAAQGVAGLARPDVGAVYSGYGDGHGYSFTLPSRGSAPQTVCVFAINVGPGTSNPLLGCRVV